MPVGSFRNTTEGAVFPTWKCLVDGDVISSTAFKNATNRWSLCEDDALQDGLHIITLQIQVPAGQQFWFDYMQYMPSETVALDNANVYIDSTDPVIFYGVGWTSYAAGRGQAASALGTSLNLKFYGMLSS